MERRPLGNTGIHVSPLGLGTVKFGRNQGVKYPTAFELPTDQAIRDLLSLAQDLNINLLDTAPAYGSSEERLGKLLSGPRDSWIIGTKVGEEYLDGQSHFDFTPEQFQFSIERSLKRLNTDYLDYVLVHSNGDDVNIIQRYDVFNTLDQLKTRGLIRAFGMSTKTVEGGLQAVAASDIVMVTYNPLFTEEEPVLDHAEKLNKGIIIKKALASGHLQKFSGENPVQQAFSMILKQPAVSSIIVGTLNPTHLAENVACLEDI